MKRIIYSVLAVTLLLAACVKEQKSDEGSYVNEIGARIENFSLKSIADPDSGKIRFEAGDRILLDNGSETAEYVWNSTREVFVADGKALEVADTYRAAYPASKASGSTPGNLVIDSPKSIDLNGAYIKDLPLIADYSDGILVFKPYCEVHGQKAHTQTGSGTKADPYIVSSWEDVRTLVEKGSEEAYYSAYYKQTEDITLPSNFRFSTIARFTGEYDGGGHEISGLVMKNSKLDAPSGLFGVIEGATIKGLKLTDINFVSDQMFLGAIAGKAINSTVENCSVDGYMKSTARFSWDEWVDITTDKANHGFCGGITGYSDGSTITGCDFYGQISSFGKNTGCIAGFITGKTTIDACYVHEGAEVYSGYHCVGGIAGAVTGESSVKNCKSEVFASTTGYWVGGIAGYLQSGSVEACVTGSRASVTGRQFNVGGIVGAIQPQDKYTALVKDCTSWSDVQGQYSVGGVVGYVESKSGSSVSIEGCTYIGGTLYATGTNSNKYNLVAGICGWIASGGEVSVSDCASLPGLIKCSIQNATTGSDNATTIGAAAGLVGFQNNSSQTTITRCYSSLEKSRILVRYRALETAPAFIHYGSIFGGGGLTLVCDKCYHDGDLAPYSRNDTHNEGCPSVTVAQMTDGTLLGYLGSAWKAGDGGFPVPAGFIADPNPRLKSTLRVSVIGDSISTFAGYIPAGYNYHYPCADGSVTQVSQTYWYRLIYDKLSDARLDLNMSYSGSAVTRSTDSSKSGNHWYDNCYIQRYLRQGGVGEPDIVLIHGGTNDYAHNDCPLYPGDEVRCKNAPAPSADILAEVFSKADAAKNYDEAAALNDTDFCSAYVKLIKLLQEQYPEVKIVCIIGDYLSEGVEKSTIAIAEHYGAKVVDLLKVNGYNDQVYMPKHDYNGTSGCHPDARAMEFIADKIYTELGSWLEN